MCPEILNMFQSISPWIFQNFYKTFFWCYHTQFWSRGWDDSSKLSTDSDSKALCKISIRNLKKCRRNSIQRLYNCWQERKKKNGTIKVHPQKILNDIKLRTSNIKPVKICSFKTYRYFNTFPLKGMKVYESIYMLKNSKL